MKKKRKTTLEELKEFLDGPQNPLRPSKEFYLALLIASLICIAIKSIIEQ